jgi:outer membrane protein
MNFFLRRWRALILAGGLLALSQAHADPFRIGVVDPDRVFKEASSVKATEVRLKQEFAAREKVLIDQGAAARSLAEAFERDAPTLSASARATRQRQMAERDLEIQRAGRTMQEDVDARTNEERQRLMEQINRVVKQIAESDKLDLVLQQAVYFNPKNDLTNKVIEILNAQGAK